MVPMFDVWLHCYLFVIMADVCFKSFLYFSSSLTCLEYVSNSFPIGLKSPLYFNMVFDFLTSECVLVLIIMFDVCFNNV